MTDWPQTGEPTRVFITPISPLALGVEMSAIAVAAPTSIAHGTANLARFFPFVVPEPIVIAKLFWYNGATISGNVDVGVFTEGGGKITSTGAVAQATANVLQEVDITDIIIGRGRFYLGLSASSATATFFSNTISVQMSKAVGYLQQAIAHPLPSPATFAPYSTAAIQPLFGLSGRTIVA